MANNINDQLLMHILIFKTNLSSEKLVQQVAGSLNSQPAIKEWTVDTADCDYVLRVVADEQIGSNQIIRLINQNGFYCNVLAD